MNNKRTAPGKPATATPTDRNSDPSAIDLYRQADATLRAWKEWAAGAYQSGELTPLQFLAVVLRVINWLREDNGQPELSEQDGPAVIADWFTQLLGATALRDRRYLTPYDSQSLLKLASNRAPNTPHGWLLAVNEVDAWLTGELGYGPWCNAFFVSAEVAPAAEVVPLRAAPASAPTVVPDTPKGPTSWSELLAFRKDNPRTPWTPEQKQILVVEKVSRGDEPGAGQAMAEKLGVTVSRLNELIRKVEQPGKREIARSKVA